MVIDYIIGGLIILAIILSIWKIRRDRSKGGCSAGCAGCPMANQCKSKEKDDT